MVNLIEFTLTSDSIERLLMISPVLLQSKEPPEQPLPLKACVYENLIKEDWLAYYSFGKNAALPEELKKSKLVIKNDQNFEEVYLGNLAFCDYGHKRWQWEGDLTRLCKDDIEKLEAFFNNYSANYNTP